MKPYRIRKMGTRRGTPHYSADCMLCPRLPGGPGGILTIGHLTKPAAERLVREHMLVKHGRAILTPKAP
jgi:hypothetical protein